MVVLTHHFTSLLAFAASVHALPTRSEAEELDKFPLPALVHRTGDLVARGHHHHHHNHHHHHHHHHKHNKRSVNAPYSTEDEEDGSVSELRIPQRRHSHYGGHPLHQEKRKHRHGTKVYADDPVVVSGDHNHVHTHTHGGHGHKHGHHRHGYHHGHGTKIYADDPLIVSGDGNHIHSHSHKKRTGMCEDVNLLEMSHYPVPGILSDPAWREFQHSTPRAVDFKQDVSLETRRKHHGHYGQQGAHLELTAFSKRGFLDSMVPLLDPVPGIAGVIDIVGGLSHAMLSEPLASLIISPKPSAGAMGIQSANGEKLPGYSINASNSTSNTMYLVSQDGVQANLGPKDKPVLVATPMLQTEDNTVRLYCASYDPSSASPSRLSSQPCIHDPSAGLDTNSSSTHMSQLFAWNVEDGLIKPLWHKQESSQVEAANAPAGASDPRVGGYVVGGTPSVGAADSGQSAPSQFFMIFKAHPTMQSQSDTSAESTILASGTPSDDDPSHQSQPVGGDLDDENTSSGSVDDEQGDSGVAESDDGSFRGERSTMAQDELASSPIDESVTPLTTSSSIPTVMQVEIVTSTFTMLVAPTQSLDAAGATDSTSTNPSPTP